MNSGLAEIAMCWIIAILGSMTLVFVSDLLFVHKCLSTQEEDEKTDPLGLNNNKESTDIEE